ncbi:MAG: hypothetical protein SF339_21745 [Blastocatellia bacterium]|nr:hypothetical protein [Blastocatellia bacterium]
MKPDAAMRRIVQLFVALAFVYAAFSPLRISGMGYMGENLLCADQLAARIAGGFRGEAAAAPIAWPRHGLIEPLLGLPFVLPVHLLRRSMDYEDAALAFYPLVLTSLLCVLIYVWGRRLTTDRRAYGLAIGAAFSTMLWPYAYFAMEPAQSFFLLLGGYLALGRTTRGESDAATRGWARLAAIANHLRASEGERGWGATVGFAVAIAIACSAKSNGVFLLPAVGWLVLCRFWDGRRMDRGKGLRMLLVVGVAGGGFALGAITRGQYWAKLGAGAAMFLSGRFLIEGPIDYAMNAWSILLSPNKGLAIFAPLAMLGLALIGRAWRTQPRLAVFAVLILAGNIGAVSLLRVWAEETWGPRYLHAAIGPLVLCLAASLGRERLRAPLKAAIAGCVGVGLLISFLGSFFYYGALHAAATKAGLSTLEGLQTNPHLNHVKFNAALLRVWVRGRVSRLETPVLWPRAPFWWFEAPADHPPAREIDLREYALPQPPWAREMPRRKISPAIRYGPLAGLVPGLWLLLRLRRRDASGEPLPDEGRDSR